MASPLIYLLSAFVSIASAADGTVDPSKYKYWVFDPSCEKIPSLGSGLTEGFNAIFYEYPFGSDWGSTNAYWDLGYNKTKVVATSTGITNLQVEGDIPAKTLVYGNLYGANVSLSNITVELTGYYKAPQTGFYNFSVEHANPGGAITPTMHYWFNHCSGEAYNDDLDEVATAFNVPPIGAVHYPGIVVKMQEGLYYPIKVVFVNYLAHYNFGLKAFLPDGSVQTEFNNVIANPPLL